MTNHFVGFGNSSEWLKSIDKAMPINAECITLVGKGGRFGVAVATQSVILSQVRNGEVLYFTCPVDHYQTQEFKPMFEEEKHYKRGETAWAATQEWLKSLGLSYRKAMVAFPKTLRLLEGTVEYMHYDKESDTWRHNETD